MIFLVRGSFFRLLMNTKPHYSETDEKTFFMSLPSVENYARTGEKLVACF